MQGCRGAGGLTMPRWRLPHCCDRAWSGPIPGPLRCAQRVLTALRNRVPPSRCHRHTQPAPGMRLGRDWGEASPWSLQGWLCRPPSMQPCSLGAAREYHRCCMAHAHSPRDILCHRCCILTRLGVPCCVALLFSSCCVGPTQASCPPRGRLSGCCTRRVLARCLSVPLSVCRMRHRIFTERMKIASARRCHRAVVAIWPLL